MINNISKKVNNYIIKKKKIKNFYSLIRKNYNDRNNNK